MPLVAEQSQEDAIVLRFVPLAHKIAASIQRSEQDHADLFQEGILALMQAFRRNARLNKPIDNIVGFASTVMRRRMLRYYVPKMKQDSQSVPFSAFEDHTPLRRGMEKRHGVRVPASMWVPAEPENEDDSAYFDFVFNDVFFDEFEKVFGGKLRAANVEYDGTSNKARRVRSCSCPTVPCNPRIVIEDLIRPRIEVRRFAAMESIKRKRGESEQVWQERVNEAMLVQRVTKTHVRHFHGLTVHMFFVNYMNKLRDFAKDYKARHLEFA